MKTWRYIDRIIVSKLSTLAIDVRNQVNPQCHSDTQKAKMMSESLLGSGDAERIGSESESNSDADADDWADFGAPDAPFRLAAGDFPSAADRRTLLAAEAPPRASQLPSNACAVLLRCAPAPLALLLARADCRLAHVVALDQPLAAAQRVLDRVYAQHCFERERAHADLVGAPPAPPPKPRLGARADAAALLGDARLNVVVVCAAERERAHWLRQAIAAGGGGQGRGPRLVLAEKPLAATFLECDELRRAAKRGGVVLRELFDPCAGDLAAKRKRDAAAAAVLREGTAAPLEQREMLVGGALGAAFALLALLVLAAPLLHSQRGRVALILSSLASTLFWIIVIVIIQS